MGRVRRGVVVHVLVVLAMVVVALATAGTLRAEPGLIVGLSDDSLKATPAETGATGQDLGIRAYSLSLRWSRGESALGPSAVASLQTAVNGARGARIVLWIYGDGISAPTTQDGRNQYCSFVRDALVRIPQVNDVVIWNEPNLRFFWASQFAGDGSSLAPSQYAALLAQCWDVLHAFRSNVNVVAPATSPQGNDDPFGSSNISHSPTSFLLQLGAAYRASGRTAPLFDTLGHHPYGDSAAERPWRQHDSERTIATGDLGRLVAAVNEGFGGTGQPVPGRGLPIWYLETGFQTVPDEDKRGLYFSTENWPGPVPDDVGGEPAQPPPSADSAAPDQATQLVDSIRLAYCQPYVQAVFNFQLRDEADLSRWQSGVLWADGTRKSSYDDFKRVIAEVNNRSVDCTRMKGSVWRESGSGSPRGGGSGAAAAGSAAKAATRLRWTALRPAPFGFARLGVQLLSRGKGLGGRTVTFSLRRDVFVTTTTARGIARTGVTPPLRPGRHLVTASFRGDPRHRPTGLKVLLSVQNSRASVATLTPQRAPSATRNAFSIRFDGRSLVGSLRIRTAGRLVEARRMTALGVSRNRGSAWFAARTTTGRSLVGHVERRAKRGADMLHVWLDGRQLRSVRGLDVAIVSRRR